MHFLKRVFFTLFQLINIKTSPKNVIILVILISIMLFVCFKFFNNKNSIEENIEQVVDGTIINLDDEVTVEGSGVTINDDNY